MQKQILRKYVGEEKEFNAESYGSTHTDINEVIEFFTKAKEDGATHISWNARCDYDGCSEYCEAQPFYEVEETDYELEKRVKDEAAQIKNQIAAHQRREKAEYERLKAKFG